MLSFAKIYEVVQIVPEIVHSLDVKLQIDCRLCTVLLPADEATGEIDLGSDILAVLDCQVGSNYYGHIYQIEEAQAEDQRDVVTEGAQNTAWLHVLSLD